MCPGSFANTLPVYQRSEVMMFIMGKIPVPGIYPALGSPNAGYHAINRTSDLICFNHFKSKNKRLFNFCFRFEGSRMIQVMLLKSLLQVCAMSLSALCFSFSEAFPLILIFVPASGV